ncbi:MAG: Hsp20/alpha crystallin family protein [Crocinitomicaceae bacterium]|nr:Hsp20/alpha crystallin family protein [Crocinitomicaceae bacterium]
MFGEVPAVNISEDDNNFDISVAVPGMNKEDFNISIDDGVMTISAETKSENEEKEENFTRREYNYSSFERRFTLPENAKEDAVEASYKNGILKIQIPKLMEDEQKNKKVITVS